MYFVKWSIKKELKVFDLENGKSKTMIPSVGEFSIGEFYLLVNNFIKEENIKLKFTPINSELITNWANFST